MTLIEDIIIHPRKGKREVGVPGSGLLLVTPAEFAYAQKIVEETGGKKQFIYGSSLAVSADDQLFIAGPAVGAPIAAMVMEKLIALGAEKLIMFGWCGAIDKGLKVGDVVVGNVPVSGEGTSRYYQTGAPPLPSLQLVNSLGAILEQAGIDYSLRNIWSTDAPYREDRIYLEKLHDNADVGCVDMEYSALCAVAAFRNIEFATVFLVSDELYQQKWIPGYTRKDFRAKSRLLVKLLTEVRNFGEK